mmetsp:Transcript_20870/g.18491  ORF Transcript_20870/g.18491 Transcript_20870/m.18491 type:complete len:198 (+) Transcript_20870:72-665(+)
MKLQLYSMNKETEEKQANPEQNEVIKHSEGLEDSQKAVEKDFMKQEESFRTRLAMRKNGRKINANLWGNESSINMNSISKNNLSNENSVELNSSDINFEKMSNSSMTEEMFSIIKSMSRIGKSGSYDRLKRGKTLEENNPNSLYKNMNNLDLKKDLNRSTDTTNKRMSQDKKFLLKLQMMENKKKDSFVLKEENDMI